MDTVNNITKLSTHFAAKKRTILDNTVFQLHYKGTVNLLLISVFCLSGQMWMGKPIACITTDKSYRDDLEQHCLVLGAKTIHPKTPSPLYAPEAAYPGIWPVHDDHPDYTTKWHNTYYWTMLTMFALAVANYFPHHVWKTFEGGRLHGLLQGMDRELLDDDEASRRIAKVAKQMVNFEESVTWYTATFLLCEGLNVLLCVAQMFYIHWLFDFKMWEQQTQVFMDIFTHPRSLPLLDEVFPKQVKCSMNLYGPSGTLQVLDALCHFYQNTYNELAYTILWFWLFGIGILTIAHIFFNRIGYLFKRERINILHKNCPTAEKEDVIKIVNNMAISQLFLFVQLCKAIQSLHTDDLLKQVAKEIKVTRSNPTTVNPKESTSLAIIGNS